jgi:rubrerythrin
MTKDITYHTSAVQYNEGLADTAEKLADEVEDQQVAQWCRSVGRQHRFHAARHKSALEKLEKGDVTPLQSTSEIQPKSIAEEQAEFAAQMQNENEEQAS